MPYSDIDIHSDNSSIDGYDILLKEDINIACAVATEAGLFVPVLKKVQESSLDDLVLSFQNLVEKTRTQKLEPSDLMGGTFSLTIDSSRYKLCMLDRGWGVGSCVNIMIMQPIWC